MSLRGVSHGVCHGVCRVTFLERPGVCLERLEVCLKSVSGSVSGSISGSKRDVERDVKYMERVSLGIRILLCRNMKYLKAFDGHHRLMMLLFVVASNEI